MIYAFDLDGTLCECWYGKTSPEFPWDRLDEITRANTKDLYKDVNPISAALGYMHKAYANNGENIRFVVLADISSGSEFEQIVNFLNREYVNTFKDGEPFFKKNDIYGVFTTEDKVTILKDFANKDVVIYFDDNMSVVNLVNESLRGSKYPFAALHSTSLFFREPKDIEKL